MDRVREYFYLFKVHHWIKNLIIFLPVLVSHSFLKSSILEYIIYFLILSFLSSIIYFLNNVNDYEEDIKNKKLNYSLNLSRKKNYYIVGLIIFFILITFSYFFDQKIFIICLSYFILSILYNFYLKKKKYLDIFILSLFHVFRIIYGSLAFEVSLSAYFILFCSAIFLMIGSNKRLVEIEKSYANRPYRGKDKRKVQFLQLFFSLFAIFIFLLYTLDSSKDQYFVLKELFFVNLIIIILIIVNFLYFQKNKNQDIVMFIYKNKVNFILAMMFFMIFIGNSVSFYY